MAFKGEIVGAVPRLYKDKESLLVNLLEPAADEALTFAAEYLPDLRQKLGVSSRVLYFEDHQPRYGDRTKLEHGVGVFAGSYLDLETIEAGPWIFVDFEIPEAGHLRVHIYKMSGQFVARISHLIKEGDAMHTSSVYTAGMEEMEANGTSVDLNRIVGAIRLMTEGKDFIALAGRAYLSNKKELFNEACKRIVGYLQTGKV